MSKLKACITLGTKPSFSSQLLKNAAMDGLSGAARSFRAMISASGRAVLRPARPRRPRAPVLVTLGTALPPCELAEAILFRPVVAPAGTPAQIGRAGSGRQPRTSVATLLRQC